MIDGGVARLGQGQGQRLLIQTSTPFLGRRPLSISSCLKKNFKYKPERPKLKIHTYEELFGDPNKWDVTPGAFVLLVGDTSL